MLNRLFIGEKMFQRDYRSRMFRTTHRTKNVPLKKSLSEKTMFRTNRLFITAKTKRFREDYLSKQNIPDYLSQEKSFGQAAYCSSKFCEWKVTHKTRTDLLPVRPAISCPQDANKRQRTCHCHSHLPNLLPP